jgi:hypothetical protein
MIYHLVQLKRIQTKISLRCARVIRVLIGFLEIHQTSLIFLLKQSKEVREKAERRGAAEAAKRNAANELRDHDMESQPSLFTPLFTPQEFHFTPQESPTFGSK